MPPLTVAMIQAETHWHDPAANRRMFDVALDRVSDGTDVVVLPEMFSTGFTMASAQMAEPMDGATVGWMREAAVRLRSVICGSLVIEDGGAFFNRFIWARPDGTLACYDKRHLFRMANEHEHYAAGGQRLVIELGSWRLCPLVCYDLRFPVWFRNRGDYDVLLCVANWPAVRQVAWNALLRARAVENLAYAVGVNRVGEDGNGVAYRGGSAAYSFTGDTLLETFDVPGVFTVTLERNALEDYRASFPAWRDADEFSIS